MNNPQELADKQLEAAIWYIKHKVLLRRIIIGAIIAVDAILILYSVFGVGKDLFFFGDRRQQEAELLRSTIPVIAARGSSRPVDLQLGGVNLLRTGEVTDVVASVQNPNQQWYARFEYVIGLGEETERVSDGFVLPAQERTFIHPLRQSRGTVVFNIENISWRRINHREISDFQAWEAERLNFEVTDAEFVPSAVQGTVSRASFKIKNKSAYNYFEPKFLAMLYRGSRLVAVQSTVVEQFRTGQVREVELSWFDHIGAVSNIEVTPVIDIMDTSVYMPQ